MKSQATHRAFLSDPTYRIRFVFLPKHSSWLNQVEIVFGIVKRKVFCRGNFTSVADLEAKLRAFLNYFNLSLAHPFDWTVSAQHRHFRLAQAELASEQSIPRLFP